MNHEAAVTRRNGVGGKLKSRTAESLAALENTAPVANDDEVSSWEDSGINWWSVLLSNDTDSDPNDTKTIVSVNTTGTAGRIVFDPSNHVLRYWGADALPEGAVAEDYLIYTMADAHGAQSTARVKVIVTGFNDSPVAQDDIVEVREEVPDNLWSALLSNDVDPDTGDTKTIVSVNRNAGTAGTIEFDPDNQRLIYTAPDHVAAGATGNDYFEYTMADAHGALSTAYVKVVIHGENDAPTAADDALVINEIDEVVPLWSIVLANDRDPDVGDTKTIVSVDTTGTSAEVEFRPGKQLLVHRWDALAKGEEGDDSFTYTMADSQGVQSTATVRLHVVGRNDVPIAGDDFIAMVEDPSANLWSTVIGNDRDLDTSDVWTIAFVDSTSTGGGKVTFDPVNKVLTYQPASSVPDGVTITDSFRYVIADQHGADDAGTVTIRVTAKNVGPIAVGETFTFNEDDVINSWYGALLNDSDPDSTDPLNIVSVDTAGTLGKVTLDTANQALIYKGSDALPAGAYATDSFTYTIADNAGARSTTTATVNVVGRNDTPTAVGDAVSVDDGGTTGNLWSQLLANDSDIDLGDAFRLVRVDATYTLGSVAFDPKSQTLLYTADGASVDGLQAGETQLDYFTYTIRDNAGAESTATVNVTIYGNGDTNWSNSSESMVAFVGAYANRMTIEGVVEQIA